MYARTQAASDSSAGKPRPRFPDALVRHRAVSQASLPATDLREQRLELLRALLVADLLRARECELRIHTRALLAPELVGQRGHPGERAVLVVAQLQPVIERAREAPRLERARLVA